MSHDLMDWEGQGESDSETDESKFIDFIHLNMARMEFKQPDKVILTDFGWRGALWAYREIPAIRKSLALVKDLNERAYHDLGYRTECLIRAESRIHELETTLLEALHIIKSQSIGDDWTAEQALKFIKETANAAIKKAEGGSK